MTGTAIRMRRDSGASNSMEKPGHLRPIGFKTLCAVLVTVVSCMGQKRNFEICNCWLLIMLDMGVSDQRMPNSLL